MRFPLVAAAAFCGTSLMLVGTVSSASMPCRLPQVTLQPPTNATAVQEPLVLSVAPGPGLSRGLGDLISLEAADGTKVPAQVDVVDAGWVQRASIRGLGASGWYTVRLSLPPGGRESSDRSLVATATGFYGEVLVGQSDPGIAQVQQCATSVAITWSEPVAFEQDPAGDIELRSGSGETIACTNAPSALDAGFRSSIRLTCADFAIAALRVVRPPRSVDGGSASFPPPGEVFEATQWATDTTLGGACQIWQPNVRERSHQNLSASDLSATYAKCPSEGGCGCSGGSGVAMWALAFGVVRKMARHVR